MMGQQHCGLCVPPKALATHTMDVFHVCETCGKYAQETKMWALNMPMLPLKGRESGERKEKDDDAK